MRSFLFLCTIWKLAYISAATSPSRISLSLQLTISSQGDFICWVKGCTPPLPCHKTQRKAPNRQNSRLPVANSFSVIFLPTSKVKNQNQHRETYKNIWDAFFLNQVYQQNNEEGTWSVGCRLPRLLQTQPHGEGLELRTWACMTILNVLKCLPQLPLMV